MSDKLTRDEMRFAKHFAYGDYKYRGITSRYIMTGLLKMSSDRLVLSRDDGTTAVSLVPKSWWQS